MAEFNLDGLLGTMFGAESGSELEKLLTAKQKEQLGLQSTLSAAAALLKAGGRSPQRIGLGQALGSALEAGQGAYEKGTTGAINQLMLAAKLKAGEQDLLEAQFEKLNNVIHVYFNINTHINLFSFYSYSLSNSHIPPPRSVPFSSKDFGIWMLLLPFKLTNNNLGKSTIHSGISVSSLLFINAKNLSFFKLQID